MLARNLFHLSGVWNHWPIKIVFDLNCEVTDLQNCWPIGMIVNFRLDFVCTTIIGQRIDKLQLWVRYPSPKTSGDKHSPQMPMKREKSSVKFYCLFASSAEVMWYWTEHTKSHWTKNISDPSSTLEKDVIEKNTFWVWQTIESIFIGLMVDNKFQTFIPSFDRNRSNFLEN